jgi:hypothetical protein
LPNRPEVLQQLKQDAAGGLHEPDTDKEAARLLQAFSTYALTIQPGI